MADAAFTPELLDPLLGADLVQALVQASDGADPTVRDLLELGAAPPMGIHAEVIGHSTGGTPIRLLRFGDGPTRVLAYAFVHPDEPLGARALFGLINAWAGHAALRAAGIHWHVVLCADPDMAAWNARWSAGGRLEDFLYGSLRPEHLAREVDYGFPVDHGMFWQPDDYDGGRACWSAGRCVRPGHCGATCRRLELPAGPLPESLALAQAIRDVAPHLVVSLHDTHTGGTFAFLRHRPDPDLAEALTTTVAAASGLPRHRGQRIDSGRPWMRGVPDLIREPDLRDEERRLLGRSGVDPALRYHGNVSAAQFLESLDPAAQFLVPEAPHFTHPDFGDVTPLDETWPVDGQWRATRRGARYVIVAPVTHPDGQVGEILYRMRTAADGPIGAHDRAVSIGMLGAMAVTHRRWALARADAIWQALPTMIRDDPAHPFAAERRQIAVPGGRVNDASLRYFRLSTTYDHPATRAHAADFRWRWPIHTAQRLGSFARFLDDVGGRAADREALDQLIEALVADLPSGLHAVHDRRAAAFSQLARILLVARALPAA